MKILSFVLSTAILASTAVAASAAPNNEGDRQDVRAQTQDTKGDWVGRGHAVDHRMPRQPKQWESLGTLSATGRAATVDVTSQRPVDEIKLQGDKGAASIKKVIVTFDNGTTFVTTINAQLTRGATKTINLPGSGRKVASIQLKLGRGSRGEVSVSAR